MMQDIAVVLEMRERQEGWRLMITRQCNVECHPNSYVRRGGCHRVTPVSLRGVATVAMGGLVKLMGDLRKLLALLTCT